MATVLGIDVGEKKIGVALGKSEGGWAFTRPALLVQDWTEVWPVIQSLIEAEGVMVVVVGLPLDQDGQVGPQAERTRQFIADLKRHISVPIVERDERTTSQAVQREQGQAGQKLHRGEEDSLAAQLLVESYLQEKTT